MRSKGPPLLNSTRVIDDDASHDDPLLIHLLQVNYDLTYMITSLLKKLQTKTEMNEVNEVCSWQRHEVSININT